MKNEFLYSAPASGVWCAGLRFPVIGEPNSSDWCKMRKRRKKWGLTFLDETAKIYSRFYI